MSSHPQAKSARTAADRRLASALATSALLLVVAVASTGCMQAAAQISGKDPADPAATVARTGYRSTIAPYAPLRPSTPAPWRGRNDEVAPKPKQEQP
jgi:hypothetical protein